MVKQISVMLENIPGKLAEVSRILANEKINIRALTAAETTDFAILRLIVSDTKKAVEVLRKNRFAVSESEMIAIQMKDEPGSLAKLAESFSRSGINIEYLYPIITSKTAIVAFRVSDLEGAKKAAQAVNYQIVEEPPQ
jgi:hypothetical protein